MKITRLSKKWQRSIAKRLPARKSSAAEKTGSNSKPVRTPDIPFLVPEATLSDLYAGAAEAEVTMLPRLLRSHKWAMPEHELLVLGALTRILQPRLVIEFGTFIGGSTLVMASNMPSEGRIVTIDLDPGERSTHVHGMGVGLSDFDVGCLFRGTRFESMIQQRFANTVEFDDRDLIGQADLVFVDADHTYEFAKRDTQSAWNFRKTDGAILWHDYTWEPANPECVGVTRAVNEFWEQHACCGQIQGTRYAIFDPSFAELQGSRAA